jgi:SNF2 family DNA or RNA helicase
VLADLPDKIYENRIVVLTPAEMSIYKRLATHGHIATEDAEAVVAVIRCKQFCNYPPLIDQDCKATSKMDSFKEVIEEIVQINGHKALVFSQYKTMLDIIAAEMRAMGIKYLRIDGDTCKKTRADMQGVFNTDNTIDVMLGTEAMSAGLNFTAADYVINFDDNWAPAIMAQREDRAHRLGQKNVVTVVNFICKDTIEERIRQVIYVKAAVTAQVLGDDIDDMVLRRLGPQDMAKLL